MSKELVSRKTSVSLHHGWELLKIAAAAESDLTASNKNGPSLITIGAKTVLSEINLAELAIAAEAGVTSATVVVYAARAGGGPAEKVCSIVAVPGAQVVGIDPVSSEPSTQLYCDTLTVTGSWYDSIKTADGAGGDGVAKAMFDLYGRKYLYAVVTVISGTGAVNVYYSGV